MSKRNVNGYTRKQEEIIDKTGGVCILCGKQVTRKTFSQEHLQPKVRGGSNSINNLWAAHKDCNNQKADKTLEEFTIECDNERKMNQLFMDNFNEKSR